MLIDSHNGRPLRVEAEGHSKKRIFFVNANKILALSLATHLEFDIVVVILNSQQPGHVCMTSFHPRDFVQMATRLQYSLLVPCFVVNRQNTKGKLSLAFFWAICKIQVVQDLSASGNLFVFYDDNLNHECYDSKQIDKVKFNRKQVTLLYSWRFSRYIAPIHWLVHGAYRNGI